MSRADTIRTLRRWCLDLRADAYVKAVLHTLIQYHGDNGKWSYPAMERIARESGVSERKARKVINWLEERGHLRVNRSTGRRVNRYHLRGNPAPGAGLNGAQPGTGGGVNPAPGAGLKIPQPGTPGTSTRHTVPPTGITGKEEAGQGGNSTGFKREATA